MPATYEPIATQTISTASASVVFNSIPQTYTDLVVVADSRFTQASGRWMGVRLNNDTGANYSTIYMAGTGSSAISAFFEDTALRIGNGSASSARSGSMAHIANYTNTNAYKVSISRSVTNEYAISYTSHWRNNSAVTTLTFVCDTAESNQFMAGSMFSVYGIKAA
jgi:hypothetical protein